MFANRFHTTHSSFSPLFFAPPHAPFFHPFPHFSCGTCKIPSRLSHISCSVRKRPRMTRARFCMFFRAFLHVLVHVRTLFFPFLSVPWRIKSPFFAFIPLISGFPKRVSDAKNQPRTVVWKNPRKGFYMSFFIIIAQNKVVCEKAFKQAITALAWIILVGERR